LDVSLYYIIKRDVNRRQRLWKQADISFPCWM
jgi:hypothetical protein